MMRTYQESASRRLDAPRDYSGEGNVAQLHGCKRDSAHAGAGMLLGLGSICSVTIALVITGCRLMSAAPLATTGLGALLGWEARRISN